MPYTLCVVGPTLPDDSDVEVMVGTARVNLTLTVTITDFNLPLTEISWFIDDDPVIERPGIVITNTSINSPPATSTLELRPIRFTSEGGLYSVIVANPAGNDTTVFNVMVTSE